MFYDEHYQKDDPGPVSGRGWYTEMVDSFLAVIPPGKAMMGIGAYGYDWNDAGNTPKMEAVTVPDVWRAPREQSRPADVRHRREQSVPGLDRSRFGRSFHLVPRRDDRRRRDADRPRCAA